MAELPYVEDDDPDTGPNGNKGAKRRAFAKPKKGETLVWRGIKDPGPGWQPYIIEAEFDANKQPTFEEPYLRFRFHKNTGEFGSIVHCIDLNDRRLVWRALPSTLEGLDANHPCAFLFLTEDLQRIAPAMYEDGNAKAGSGGVTILEGGTGGSGKWPQGASALSTLLAKLRRNAKAKLDEELTEDEKRLLEILAP